jgi:tripartite motif-containing protein 71
VSLVRLLAGCVVIVALALALPGSATAAPVPLAQVGSFGSGAGQLKDPLSVALDGAGNLYVADTVNDRISVFGPDGTFIRAFGWDVDPTGGPGTFEVCTTASTCQAGIGSAGGAGQLDNPGGVALDGAGNLYVGDQINHRIDVFDTTGPSFTRAFGWNVDPTGGPGTFEVCTTASTCQSGIGAGGAGELNSPQALVPDGAGGLYVADTVNNRISVFGTAGPSFTRAFGWNVDPSGGPGTFEVCTTASTCQAGAGAGGAGDLAFPSGVALDGAGGLYVGDGVDNRIASFGTAGPSFTRAFGWDVIPGAPTGLFEVCTTASTCKDGSTGTGVGQLNDAEGVAVDCRGAVWIADNNNNRVQRFGEPGTALPPCPVAPPPADGGTSGGPVPAAAPQATGLRAAALKKCKKKHGAARRKCKRNANKLPL